MREDRGWGGRSGYFFDPEGNAWEVGFGPAQMKVDIFGKPYHLTRLFRKWVWKLCAPRRYDTLDIESSRRIITSIFPN